MIRSNKFTEAVKLLEVKVMLGLKPVKGLKEIVVTNTPRENAMINVMEKVIPTAVETSMESSWLRGSKL